MNAPNQETTLQATTEILQADPRDYHAITLDAATILTLQVERTIEDDEFNLEGDIFAIASSSAVSTVAHIIPLPPCGLLTYPVPPPNSC
jgi:hypothetical protein